MQEIEMQDDDRQIADDESQWWHHQDEKLVTMQYSDGYEGTIFGTYEWEGVAK